MTEQREYDGQLELNRRGSVKSHDRPQPEGTQNIKIASILNSISDNSSLFFLQSFRLHIFILCMLEILFNRQFGFNG